MARTTKTENPVNPPATFSPEALAALLNEVTEGRKLMAAQMAELTALKAKVADAPAKISIGGKSDKAVQNELATIRAFKRLGIKDIQPHKNVLTFRKWTEAGYRPKEGSKAVKVANLRLWHISQCRPMTAAELKAAKDQPAAAADRQSKASKSAQIVPIGAGASPQ